MLCQKVQNRALTLWIVETASHAVIHGGIVERPGDLASGRLGEELIRLLLAYLGASDDRD
jgi:hypothetical protein